MCSVFFQETKAAINSIKEITVIAVTKEETGDFTLYAENGEEFSVPAILLIPSGGEGQEIEESLLNRLPWTVSLHFERDQIVEIM